LEIVSSPLLKVEEMKKKGGTDWKKKGRKWKIFVVWFAFNWETLRIGSNDEFSLVKIEEIKKNRKELEKVEDFGK